MVFILESVGLWSLLLLSAFWWMRIRGLCKLPDGKDWLWGKLGLALVGWATFQPLNLSTNLLLMGEAVFPPCSLAWGQNMIGVMVQFSHSVMSDSLQPHGLQHARLLCPSLSPGVCSNSCPLSRWWQTTILFSVIPFFFYLLSFLASGSFPMSQLLASGGQSIGASASISVLPITPRTHLL